MDDREDVWIPLVDEPIGSIVEQLVSSPHRILAFRTFAYIRVGILLGQLLVDNDVPAYDGTETWVEMLLRGRVAKEAGVRGEQLDPCLHPQRTCRDPRN